MIEFNPDGSIKLPDKLQKKKNNIDFKMRNTKCIQIKKDVINFESPKKCLLTIKPSEKLYETLFIENVFKYFNENSQTPLKIKKEGKTYEIEVGTDFKRCTECNQFITRLRNSTDFQIIEDKGNCTWKKRTFCYEDYFE